MLIYKSYKVKMPIYQITTRKNAHISDDYKVNAHIPYIYSIYPIKLQIRCQNIG